MVIHGNRLELLRQVVIDWVRSHPLAPLENEIALVQSNGVAQWLKLGFAREHSAGGLGISAALQTMLPQRFVWRAYRQVLGEDNLPSMAPFDAEPLTWRLMRLLPALIDQPEFSPLRRYLDHDPDLRKRYQLSQRLAALLQNYQLLRADWLSNWEQNRDRISAGRRGGDHPIPEEQRWQAILWRALVADAPEALAQTSRSTTHRRFLAAIRGHAFQRPANFPRRVIVFGLSSLPVQSLEAIAALGKWCQVLMCVLNPSRHDWSELVSDHDLLLAAKRRYPVRPAPPGSSSFDPNSLGHPLLAAWGRQGRDLIRLLDVHDERERYEERFTAIGQRVDLFEQPDGLTMLGQLQADILDLRPRAESRKHWPAVDPDHDASIRFHICHSPLREVEVLHDQLLAAMANDRTLQARHILVMVPDVTLYAPSIRAVFGRFSSGDRRYLAYNIADGSNRRNNALLAAVERLLNLPQSRLPASELFDLLEVPAIQKRFGFESSDITKLRKWIDLAGIKWGLDTEHLRERGLGTEAARNTWKAGIERLLLGYAGGENMLWNGIAPVPVAGAIEAELIGLLDKFVQTIARARKTLAAAHVPLRWCEILRTLLDDFFIATNQDESLALLKLQQCLQEWFELTSSAGFTEPLSLAVAREFWLASLDNEAIGRPFMGGGVTFATLTPMRSIPFRVVALMGMNDESYPRHQPPSDFDLIASDPRPGDRSRREDDRYLFLEALLSARSRLIVSWVGRSVTDNEARPPSVLVSQLRDHLARGWRLASADDQDHSSGSKLIDAITIEHPLQPFSPLYFSRGGDPRLFSYAVEWQRALAERHRKKNKRLDIPSTPGLPPLSKTVQRKASLSDLKEFLRSPPSRFLRDALGVRFQRDAAATDDHERFVLNGLQAWQLSDSLIKAQSPFTDSELERKAALEAALERARVRGELPAGGYEALALTDYFGKMDALFRSALDVTERWPLALSERAIYLAHANTELVDRLDAFRASQSGEVARLLLVADRLHDRPNGNPRPEKLLSHWIEHLAGHLTGTPITTAVIGLTGQVRLPPLDPAKAYALLAALCEAWTLAAERALPVTPIAAFAWIKAISKGKAEAFAKARDAFERDQPEFGRTSERSRDPYAARCFNEFSALWCDGEFAKWSELLYGPLLDTLTMKESHDDASIEVTQ